MIEDERVGWHHQLNGHEYEQTPGNSEGQGSLVSCSQRGHRVRHDLRDRTMTNLAQWHVCLIIFSLEVFPENTSQTQTCLCFIRVNLIFKVSSSLLAINFFLFSSVKIFKYILSSIHVNIPPKFV